MEDTGEPPKPEFGPLHLVLGVASAILTGFSTIPLLAVFVMTTLVIGGTKLADSGVASVIAILVCALTGVPSVLATLLVRWMRRDAGDISLVAILLGSAGGVIAAAVLMSNGWTGSSAGRDIPIAWKPMLLMTDTLVHGIKNREAGPVIGLMAGASIGTMLASLVKKRRRAAAVKDA